MKKRIFMAALALVVGCLSMTADAQRYHSDPLHQRPGLPMAPVEAVVSPEQREQIHLIFMNDQSRLDLLHLQVAMARRALIAKLLSSDKKVDVTREVARLKQAREALIDERVKLAFKARTIMSSQQLSQASQLWNRWEDLRAQERSLFEQGRSHQDREQ